MKIQLWTTRSPQFRGPCHHGDYPDMRQAAQAASSLVWEYEEGEYREVDAADRVVRTIKIPTGDKRRRGSR